MSLPVPSLKKAYQNTPLVQQSSSLITDTDQACSVTQGRRSANYKPNIWSFDFVQSLQSRFIDGVYRIRIEKLKGDFMLSLSEEPESSKVHNVDSISKLGLSSVFTEFIKDALDSISSNMNKTCASRSKDDILKISQCFRLLRQHGYDVSEDVFVDLIDDLVPLSGKVDSDLIRGSIELFKASHLAREGEEILLKAKAISYQNIIDNREYLDDNLAQQVNHVLKGPGVVWFDVLHQIHAYEQENTYKNEILIKLAKLNFNITQAMLIEELKQLSRWWNNLGLIESINFSRDRLVESFLWTVGITFEPQHALLRKCLTKIATLILVIDDLYDIYGSFDELKRFTRTVERWDSQEMQQLPECMKICFETLRTTTAEIANEIEIEYGYDDISLYLNTAWGDFCKALLVEARWYNMKYIPSVQDYLKSGWITSSGPLAAMVTLLCTVNVGSDLLKDKLRECQHLVYYISLIIRLSNDLGTSSVELERGDSSSSVLCYMVEENVTEEMARVHVRKMISDIWKKINKELLNSSPRQQTCVNLIINMARVSQFIYRDGDCFSGPDKDTRKLIKGLLIAPIEHSTNFD